MKSILEQLYYGNILPAEKRMAKDSVREKENKNVIECESYLGKTLEGKELRMFESYCKSNDEVLWLAGRDSFIAGFQLGAQFMVDVYVKQDEF